MSSPPAGSPPASQHKRRVSHGGGVSKKTKVPSRKGSLVTSHSSAGGVGSSRSHPLRQTSFPPEEEYRGNGRRSPSVASSVGGHGASVLGGTGLTLPGGNGLGSGGGAGQTEAGQGEDEDEIDDERDDLGTTTMGVDDGAGDAEEKEAFRMLVDQFTPEQMHRYEAFRRGNLQKGSVKKLANQVLNQSITQSVATVIAGFTKIYIGEIVESALDIQEEWNQTGPLTPDHLREAVKRYRAESQGAVGSHVNGGGGMIGGDTGGPGPRASFGGGLGRMFR